MDDLTRVFGGAAVIFSLLFLVLLVLWIVLPFIVDAIRGHVKAIRQQLELQNEILRAIRKALESESDLS